MRYLLLVILFLFCSVTLSAQSLINDRIIGQIEAGEALLLNARWSDAQNMFELLWEENSKNPIGFLYLAGAIQSKMSAFEENIDSDRFFAMLDSTILLSEQVLTNCTKRDSALCYLFLGHQNAYRAIWESRFGSNLSAISYGFKARNMYEKGIETDSTLIDLYFGLGSYHYWKSVKAGILTWTGILKNDREKGLMELDRAIDSSLFSKNAARSSKIWIYINENEYEQAIDLAKKMHLRYPNGNFFLWPQAESYYKMGEFSKAIEIYDTLLVRLKDQPGNYYNIIEVVYYIYQSYWKNNQKDKAREILLYFDSIKDNFSKKTRREQRRKISFLSRKN